MAQTDQPPCRLPRYRLSSPISVVVDKGAKQQKFFVHESLLTHASQYFRTALSSRFKEGETRTCNLEEDDAYAFDLLVQYLYTNDYDVTLALSDKEGGAQPFYFRLHAQAYALGNKLVASKFKRLVLCKLATVLPRSGITMKLILEMAAIIYEGTSSEDGGEMRTLMAKYCASRFGKYKGMVDESWSKEEITALADSQLPEFVADVMGEVQGVAIFSAEAIMASLSLSNAYQYATCWEFKG